jgi:hypothetical protein
MGEKGRRFGPSDPATAALGGFRTLGQALSPAKSPQIAGCFCCEIQDICVKFNPLNQLRFCDADF